MTFDELYALSDSAVIAAGAVLGIESRYPNDEKQAAVDVRWQMHEKLTREDEEDDNGVYVTLRFLNDDDAARFLHLFHGSRPDVAEVPWYCPHDCERCHGW
jgi:hypothetical protein